MRILKIELQNINSLKSDTPIVIDFEKEAAIALCFSVLITFLGHTILIPTFAIEGAAIASLIGLLSFEIVLSYIAYKKAGIIPTIIGRFSRKIK